MDRNPRNAKVKERERKEKEERKKGKKHENKPTNIVPLGRLNAAEIAATTKEKASLEAAQPRQTKKRADRQREKDKGRTLTGIQSKTETTKTKAETKLPKLRETPRKANKSRTLRGAITLATVAMTMFETEQETSRLPRSPL